MIETYIVTVEGFDPLIDEYIEEDVVVKANGREPAIEKAVYIFLERNPDCHYEDNDILNVRKIEENLE